MSSIDDDGDSKEANIRRLRKIAALVPDENIRVNAFTIHYPNYDNVPKEQELIDEFIAQVLSWYLTSVTSKDKELATLIESRDKELASKDKELASKDKELASKDKELASKDKELAAFIESKDKELAAFIESKEKELASKDKELATLIESKDKELATLIESKDKELATLSLSKNNEIATLNAVVAHISEEKKDVLTALKQVTRRDIVTDRKWSTVTRSDAWKALVDRSGVRKTGNVGSQQHPRKAALQKKFSAISTDKWEEEINMYPDIFEALRSAFYNKGSSPKVVDTHDSGDLRADGCVSDYDDEKTLYCLWYFIEFKYLKIALNTSDQCGQMLDYFYKAKDKQPYRQEFVGILSNFQSAWVFTARFEGEADSETITVERLFAPSLTDAIIYADVESQKQYSRQMPKLDSRLPQTFDLRAVGKQHFVLQVKEPKGEIRKSKAKSSNVTATSTVKTRRQEKVSAGEYPWSMPTQHAMRGEFILKAAYRGANVRHEIEILKKIREAKCVHLPELVWEPGQGMEFGILPVGEPIRFSESWRLSRKVVEGLMEGLKWLHDHNIIHRDIRPSNLVMDEKQNVVIVDYETAVVREEGVEVEYEGGFICWPKRLILSHRRTYVPEPEDDLFASILAVSTMVFPAKYDGFRVRSIGVSTVGDRLSDETRRLLKLWDEIEESEDWGPYKLAAEKCDYEQLKKLGQKFWHI